MGELLRVAALIRTELLTKGPARRGLLGRAARGEVRAWFVSFSDQDEPTAMILLGDAAESFAAVFSKMKTKSVAIVIDLTAALKGLRAE